MKPGTAQTSSFRRLGVEVLGWLLVVIGIVLMPLPGPGMVIVVSGVALLSQRYVWAQRLLEPLRKRAVEAAQYSVATWSRVFLSFLGGAWLLAIGIVWFVGPDIPEFDVLGYGFGPELPAQGWGTALGLWASAAAAWVLLAYSVVRFRFRNPRPAASVR